MIDYAEIGITTNFSFLRGGSHPQDYVHQASELHLSAIGIADHNTLAGIVRAYSEARKSGSAAQAKHSWSARASSSSTARRTSSLYPRDRAAYGRLCRLLTRGKRGSDTEKARRASAS